MFCTSCGKKILDNSKFCNTCGSAIEDNMEKKTDSVTNKKKELDYIWGYRFKSRDDLDLLLIGETLEARSKYNPIKEGLKNKKIYVYKRDKQQKESIVIFTEKKGEVFIVGNNDGLYSVKSKLLRDYFRKPCKEKIFFDELPNTIISLVEEFNLVTGSGQEKSHGVGGWLGLFVFGLGLGGIIDIISSFAMDFSVLSLIDVAIGAYAIYTCYLLIKIKPKGVINAKIILFIYLIINLLWLVVEPESVSSEDSYSNPVRGLIFSIVWLLYFFLSSRVKNTYNN